MNYTESKLDQIFDKNGGKCHLCGEKLNRSKHGSHASVHGAWQVDHNKPVSKGGTDDLSNLFPACVNCNQEKGNSSTAEARRKINR